MDTADCPLAFGPNDQRRCVWCGERITTGRRDKRWCRQQCVDDYAANHWWGKARRRRLELDGYRCTRCDAIGSQALEALLLWILGAPSMKALDLDEWDRNEWRAWRFDHRAEVNHRTAVLGRHHTTTCAHHVDGLETLCHSCHLDETDEQYRERAGAELTAADLDAVTLDTVDLEPASFDAAAFDTLA